MQLHSRVRVTSKVLLKVTCNKSDQFAENQIRLLKVTCNVCVHSMEFNTDQNHADSNSCWVIAVVLANILLPHCYLTEAPDLDSPL